MLRINFIPFIQNSIGEFKNQTSSNRQVIVVLVALAAFVTLAALFVQKLMNRNHVIKIGNDLEHPIQDDKQDVKVTRDSDRSLESVIPPSQLRKRATFTQIHVLSQNFEDDGGSKCGFHALKNALVGLAIANNKGIAQDFQDKTLFKEFYQVSKQYKDDSQEDASIATLTQTLHGLQQMKKDELPKSLDALQEILIAQPQSITFLNPCEGSISAGIDQTSLTYLANLVEISRNTGPFQHAFCIGIHGHWITLILEKDERGIKKWYGCDSWDNDSRRFADIIGMLDQLLIDPLEKIKIGYHDAVGEGFARKAKWFNPDGTLNPEDEKSLLGAQKKTYIDRVLKSFEFMKRMDWLKQAKEDLEIHQHLKNLFIMAMFFHEDAQRRGEPNCLKELLPEIEEALSKCRIASSFF